MGDGPDSKGEGNCPSDFPCLRISYDPSQRISIHVVATFMEPGTRKTIWWDLRGPRLGQRLPSNSRCMLRIGCLEPQAIPSSSVPRRVGSSLRWPLMRYVID